MSDSIRFGVLKHQDPRQAERVLEVLLASYREEARLLGIADFPPLARTVAQVQGATSQFLGCFREGVLVAVAEVSGATGDKSIDAFTVHPGWFRQGLGSELLKFLLQRFAGEEMSVSTAAANRPAIRLYEGQGFVAQRRWRNRHGIEMIRLGWNRLGRNRLERNRLERNRLGRNRLERE